MYEKEIVERLIRLEREFERLKTLDRVQPPTVITDHGALSGLGDNDHPQYRLVADPIDHGALSGLEDDDHTQYAKGAGTVGDNRAVRFNGTDGRTIQNSAVTIGDSGDLYASSLGRFYDGGNSQVWIGDGTHGSIKIGKASGSSGRTPFIDFYANGTDYIDARIKASEGASGAHFGGILNVYAKTLKRNGYVGGFFVPQAITYVLSGVSFSASTDYNYTVTSYNIPSDAVAVWARMSVYHSAAGSLLYAKMYGAPNYDLYVRTITINTYYDVWGFIRISSTNQITLYGSTALDKVYLSFHGYVK